MISHLLPELSHLPKFVLACLDFLLVFFILIVLPTIALSVYYAIIRIWQNYTPKIQLLWIFMKMWIQSLFSHLKKTHSSSTIQNCSEPLTPSDLSELSSLAPRTFPKISASHKKPLRGKDGKFTSKTRG